MSSIIKQFKSFGFLSKDLVENCRYLSSWIASSSTRLHSVPIIKYKKRNSSGTTLYCVSCEHSVGNVGVTQTRSIPAAGLTPSLCPLRLLIDPVEWEPKHFLNLPATNMYLLVVFPYQQDVVFFGL